MVDSARFSCAYEHRLVSGHHRVEQRRKARIVEELDVGAALHTYAGLGKGEPQSRNMERDGRSGKRDERSTAETRSKRT